MLKAPMLFIVLLGSRPYADYGLFPDAPGTLKIHHQKIEIPAKRHFLTADACRNCSFFKVEEKKCDRRHRNSCPFPSLSAPFVSGVCHNGTHLSRAGSLTLMRKVKCLKLRHKNT